MTTEGLGIRVHSDFVQHSGVVARKNRAATASLSLLKRSRKQQLEESSKGENRNEIFPGSSLGADQNRAPKDGPVAVNCGTKFVRVPINSTSSVEETMDTT
jgi:hypothetical protein